MIYQSERSECALACLCMILNFYGNKINLSGIRKKHPPSIKGTNLESLISLSEKNGLSSRAVKVELEQVDKLKLPCILHWDLDHFVVLTKIKNKRYLISDPASGEKKITKAELSKHFTGIALELMPKPDFKKKDRYEKISILDLLKNCKGLYGALVKMFFLSVVLMFFSLITPYYMRITIDEVIPSNDHNLAFILAFGFFLILLFNLILNLTRNFISIRISYYLSDVLTFSLYSHLFSLPVEYFFKRHLGDVVSRFKSLSNIKKTVTSKVVEIVLDGLMSLITLILMFSYDVKLTLVVITSILIYISFRLSLFFPLKRHNEELIVKSANENNVFMENVKGVQTIKLLSMNNYKMNKWHNLFIDSLNCSTKIGYMGSVFSLGRSLVFGIENIAIIYISTKYIINGSVSDNFFTLGMLTAFISYKSQFTSTSSSLVDKLIDIKMLNIDLERISDIYLSEPENDVNTEINHEILGGISVDSLSFKYDGDSDNDYVFKNISFKAEPGDTVVITGRSGCGKTTLIKTIVRLLNPTSGSVLLDGKNINSLPLFKIRSDISAVMQDDVLFSGTIIDNISVFSSNVDMNKLIECAQVACIHDDICKFPMGYQTLISDFGSAFSEGQKQRMYLARALYLEPKIIFLDEFTSNLDMDTERRILDNLSLLKMTKVVIAHRKEVIDKADFVVEL